MSSLFYLDMLYLAMWIISFEVFENFDNQQEIIKVIIIHRNLIFIVIQMR